MNPRPPSALCLSRDRGGSWLVIALGCVGLLLACSSEREAVVVAAYGEAFIEDGIPAEDMDDGWSVEFARFDVTIGGATVGGETIAGSVTVDLSQSSDGAGQEVGRLELQPGEYTDPSFVIERVEVVGSAHSESEEKTFSWIFERAVTYDECQTTTSVVLGEPATFQITVHADHLFFDSLVAEEPALLFQPLADADADGDGRITQEELAETDIGAYDPGSDGGIDDLWAFLEAQSRTLGHVDGEGHCHAAQD